MKGNGLCKGNNHVFVWAGDRTGEIPGGWKCDCGDVIAPLNITEGRRELIARLLNWYYTDRVAAERILDSWAET